MHFVERQTTDMKNVLFIHNSIPEYRIAFWKELKKRYQLSLLIIDDNIEKKIYGFDIDISELNVLYKKDLKNKELENLVKENEIIILPPADNLSSFLFCEKIAYICKIYNKPFIYWTEKWEALSCMQPLIKKIKNKIQRLMIYNLCKKSNACIVSGTKSYAYLKNIGVIENKINIAYDSNTSLDNEEDYSIREKYNIQSEKKIILFFGRLVNRKGCKQLIEAYIKYIYEKGNAVLLICGSGEEEDNLKALATNNKSIIFAGKIQPKNRKKYFEQSDVFVLPSIVEKGVIEAWGLTVNEALECGTPVIVTDAVGSGYDLINEKNGKIICSDNIIEELGKALIYTLNKEFNRNIIIEQEKKFSVNNMAIAFSDVIERILS